MGFSLIGEDPGESYHWQHDRRSTTGGCIQLMSCLAASAAYPRAGPSWVARRSSQ